MHSLRENMSFNATEGSSSTKWWKFGADKSVTSKIALALVVSLACGGYAASLTNSWFEDELNRYKMSMKTEAVAPAPEMKKIVVASRPVKHGEELTTSNTKTIDWAAEELPATAFMASNALFTPGGKRYALASLEANEPVLSSKITKPGKGASLSAKLGVGKTAVTIRVDDILGVGGLIVPNDRVDILWTNKPKRGAKNSEPFTELLIPSVRVLALDQSTGSILGKSRVARAVTIEVDLRQAQKITLGSQTGELNLVLRGHAGGKDNRADAFQRVSLSHLGKSASGLEDFPIVPVSAQPINFNADNITTASIASAVKPARKTKRKMLKVVVTRGTMSEDYSVIDSSTL